LALRAWRRSYRASWVVGAPVSSSHSWSKRVFDSLKAVGSCGFMKSCIGRTGSQGLEPPCRHKAQYATTAGACFGSRLIDRFGDCNRMFAPHCMRYSVSGGLSVYWFGEHGFCLCVDLSWNYRVCLGSLRVNGANGALWWSRAGSHNGGHAKPQVGDRRPRQSLGIDCLCRRHSTLQVLV